MVETIIVFEDISLHIINQLKKAENAIIICVAWLTDLRNTCAVVYCFLKVPFAKPSPSNVLLSIICIIKGGCLPGSPNFI